MEERAGYETAPRGRNEWNPEGLNLRLFDTLAVARVRDVVARCRAVGLRAVLMGGIPEYPRGSDALGGNQRGFLPLVIYHGKRKLVTVNEGERAMGFVDGWVHGRRAGKKAAGS